MFNYISEHWFDVAQWFAYGFAAVIALYLFLQFCRMYIMFVRTGEVGESVGGSDWDEIINWKTPKPFTLFIQTFLLVVISIVISISWGVTIPLGILLFIIFGSAFFFRGRVVRRQEFNRRLRQ